MKDKETQSRKACAECGQAITGPLWKRYCSDACKMRAYRRRKKNKAADNQERNSVTVYSVTE